MTLQPTARGSYWAASRAHRYSLLFALPLLLLYEGLALLLAHDGAPGAVRNGADVLLRAAFQALAGPYASIAFGACLVGGALWLVGRDMRRHGTRLRPGIFLGMLAESAVLAALFGLIVGLVTAALLGRLPRLALSPVDALDAWTLLMLSLGAGLYEELVFRVLLVGGLAAGARHLLGWRPAVAGLASVLAGAAVFSAFHYIGPYGDPFQVPSFVFRLVAGVFFSGLYLLRGFGITAWTHALYDVLVLVI